MKRGELWTMAGGPGYASKPRPVVIVQDDAFAARDSVTVCLITTDPADLPVFRIAVDPTAENGLKAISRLMVDKVTTVPKSRLGQCIGRLADDNLLRLNRSLLVFLGLAR
ncbi:MAG: type II toxin-antitoxin system PemK/MazF family toxin [Planctomycetes bacterium]|uniref:Growth inhibitor PemK n=1 Tax=Synechococcus lacustris str. Tous TaxID=1910958 RepID=A0A2P7EDI9_9SYNE|nr:type II toxin-antitoxin system PemK/MazF family toxin [Synechococcus lacustris]NBU75259.1 type II toxin-antitoxin system PemK/MazF family toxin [Planctomycetota bacterium]PSI01266.1 growth inhibitor PemK [Synechococcus lacustris str. Tous]